ncbi:MAG: hypothetical protein WCL25_02150 [bacterium]
MKRIMVVKINKKEVIQMKKLLIVMLAALVGLFNVLPCYAASSANVSVNAVVPNNTPQLSLVIKELATEGQEPWTGTDVSAMTFGQLTTKAADGSDAGVWFSPKYYCVFLFTTSYGNHYEVRSTCAGLSNGATPLPTGSFMLVPGYASADEWSAGNAQGVQPTGSTLGGKDSAVGTDKLIYRSETAASNRIIRAFYSIPSYLEGGAKPYEGYEPIPTSQAAGTYTGTVTITIAAI